MRFGVTIILHNSQTLSHIYLAKIIHKYCLHYSTSMPESNQFDHELLYNKFK